MLRTVIRQVVLPLLAIFCIAGLAKLALGADPACVDQTPASPLVIYDGCNGYRLCAPVTDVNGDPLEGGELTSCSIVTPQTTMTQAATPGQYLEFPKITGGGPKLGTIAAYCQGSGGVGGSTADYTAQLRCVAPGPPAWKP